MNIGIFASGNGSNAEQLVHYFKGHKEFVIKGIFCNNPEAFVLQRAARLNVPAITFTRQEFDSEDFLQTLSTFDIEFIILAGFLWKIPQYMIDQFPARIINIHPALLPAYGGKGMYGEHVHQAVIRNRDKMSGITIHVVNENFDEGRIIFQATCEVAGSDTPETLAEKIHALEYNYFPSVTEEYLNEIRTNKD